MRKQVVLLLVLLNSCLFVDSPAQVMPLVYQVENTGADCPKPPLPSVSELPAIPNLPDPFAWADGRGRISNFSDWRYRRAEIGAQIQYYEIGQKPVRPDTMEASYSGGVLTVTVTVNGKILTLTSQVTLPAGAGPFPAVIGMNSPSGSIPPTIFSSRNIAQITFNYNQVTTDGNAKNTDPYYQLYPGLNIDNTGQYSAWAWGVSRIVDGLELVQGVLPIDLKRIAVSGCSRGGKMALFAGAFDERIALTIAQESGGGGATSWRYSHSEPNGTVEKIDNTDYGWFMNPMKQFSGDNVSKLPVDHHELGAMCAPRALFVTANPDFIWLSNPSCYVNSKAVQQVYSTLGIPDRFGYSIVGGHGHCAVPGSQIPEIEAFVEKFLLGRDTVNTNIGVSPYNTDLTPWITWTAPTLSNNTSFFGRPSLLSPPHLQTGLDTAITLKWSKVEDAGKYFIQISTDPTFAAIAGTDSTTADTVKTITGLSQGKKYYWRVQAQSTAGAGPWSEAWNFTTFILPPTMTQLVGAAPYPNRDGWVSFRWRRANRADFYVIQLSDSQGFATVTSEFTASDTVKILTGFYEGQSFYWRVQPRNLTGSGLWSDVLSFTLFYAPTDLFLRRSATKEITLAWTDHSTIENGYVIERKQSPQTSFAVLDTLKGSGSEYVDKNVEQGQTYAYRIRTFAQSAQSDYSNEASLFVVVDVEQEEEEVPKDYSLSQNYPNPFNPSTVISYQLPALSGAEGSAVSFVTLKIFDVLGREAATLVETEQRAGKYIVPWDASGFTGGVYLYRLSVVPSARRDFVSTKGRDGQTGDFVETKRMILLK